jgi:hypothetical protein
MPNPGQALIPHTREYAQAKADHWMEKVLSHTKEAELHEQLAVQALEKYHEWVQKKNDTPTDEELYARVKKRLEEKQKKKGAPTDEDVHDPNKQWVEVGGEREEVK